jgi:FHS family L-fucose permease-like MFS transporter
LVPHLKASLELNHQQAQLVQFFFFGAYFIMSFPAGMILKKIGYQRAIVLALGIMALGTFMFYPASIMRVYGMFLLALFILATGITILQVAANPYVAVLGPEQSSAARLNLAQGFNSIGHTIAPMIGAAYILQEGAKPALETVQVPYIVLALIMAGLALAFSFIKLPNIEYAESSNEGFQLKNYPGLYLGMIAIFCYVGAEISIGSFIVEYFTTEESLMLPRKVAGAYVSYYWGGAMVGRFLGAISLSENLKPQDKNTYMMGVTGLAIGVVSISNWTTGNDWQQVLGFGIMLVINYLAFAFGGKTASKQLTLFAIICASLLILSMFGQGLYILWPILAIGLFNSIMWSNIFTLAIQGLKQYAGYGSSLLVMMIAGGAIIPLIQGFAADQLSVKYSFLVPFLAYLYLAWYGRRVHKAEI